MSDRMTPIPFPELMHWIFSEHKDGSVFGVRRPFVSAPGKMLDLFSEHLETPFGPAAGPHTQLAQNLVAAYYAGSRFFELKTVQTLDGEDLPVSKPCILASDECYNVEWSTELRVQEAFDEYVKAWYAIKLVCKEFGLGDPDGFMFNMSVGYNYEGITSKKIDDFIEGLKDAKKTPVFMECEKWALAHLSDFSNVDEAYIRAVNPHVCTSITLSTLHGCPPEEIEKIASYLIREKKLNTFVKCNPTLLGYNFARKTLDEMGYDYIVFDDFHFNDDLQWRDAVPMFKRLLSLADKNAVSFGLKLSNTFPVTIANSELPGSEMYMSGRSLYPLTIEMARRISDEFNGKMRLSFSGGIDLFNIAALYEAGIWPITMATTMLKPGGYQRLTQMAVSMQKHEYRPFTGVSVGKIAYLAMNARTDSRHVKAIKPAPSRKLTKKVPLTTCFTAPCTHGCPIGQDIPEYVHLVGEGNYPAALSLILEKNPLPFITGRICSHRCMDKCTRNFYEESVHIRDAKLLAARQGYDAIIDTIAPPADKNGIRVAIVGGGPAGMAAAHFLARQGADVTLFEQREKLGGIVRYVIPGFRIGDLGIDRDAAFLEKLGVTVKTNTKAPALDALRADGFDKIIYATGAWQHGKVALESGSAMNVLDFLEQYKAETLPDLGSDIVVIGGGNTAMDAARAAKRIRGTRHVRLVYRRTRRYMPADEEELSLALEDGVEFMELLSPVSRKDGKLLCSVMQLGDPDASGRRSPVETGETLAIPCTTLISAVGEKIDTAAFKSLGIATTERGKVALDAKLATSVPGVYVIGDANRGPATVVEAIRDARIVADDIVGAWNYESPACAKTAQDDCLKKQGVLRVYDSAGKEAERCLSCGAVCECCVQVCPNRANIALDVPGLSMPQILHIDRMCNECGNCIVFCPYDSAPYKEKLTLFSTKAEFDTSKNLGFYYLGDNKFKLRLDDVRTVTLGSGEIDPDVEKILSAVLEKYTYLL